MFELVCTSDGGLRGGAGKTTSPVTSVGQMEVLLTSVCREGFKICTCQVSSIVTVIKVPMHVVPALTTFHPSRQDFDRKITGCYNLLISKDFAVAHKECAVFSCRFSFACKYHFSAYTR